MLIWEYAAIPKGGIGFPKYPTDCFDGVNYDEEIMKSFSQAISKKDLRCT